MTRSIRMAIYFTGCLAIGLAVPQFFPGRSVWFGLAVSVTLSFVFMGLVDGVGRWIDRRRAPPPGVWGEAQLLADEDDEASRRSTRH